MFMAWFMVSLLWSTVRIFSFLRRIRVQMRALSSWAWSKQPSETDWMCLVISPIWCLFSLHGAKHLRKNSLTASCRGVLLCLKPATEHIIRSLKTWLRLSDSFSSTVFHRTVIHSNSLQFIVMNRIRDLSRDWSRLIFLPAGLVGGYFYRRQGAAF